MPSSLPNLVNNLAEGIHKTKYKNEHINKKCETCGIKYKHCELKNVKDDLIKYKCLCFL